MLCSSAYYATASMSDLRLCPAMTAERIMGLSILEFQIEQFYLLLLIYPK